VAITECPECGKNISDKASVCPHCGYSIDNTNGILNRYEENSFEGSLKFRHGSYIAVVGYCVLQIGTFFYCWASSWLNTFYSYGVQPQTDYYHKLRIGSTCIAIGGIAVFIGLLLCFNAYKNGNVTERIRNYNWGLFSIIIEIASFVVAYIIPRMKYEAWFNPLLFITTAVIGIIISTADLVLHVGQKRISSIIAVIICGIVILLTIL